MTIRIEEVEGGSLKSLLGFGIVVLKSIVMKLFPRDLQFILTKLHGEFVGGENHLINNRRKLKSKGTHFSKILFLHLFYIRRAEQKK